MRTPKGFDWHLVTAMPTDFETRMGFEIHLGSNLLMGIEKQTETAMHLDFAKHSVRQKLMHSHLAIGKPMVTERRLDFEMHLD